MKDLLNKRPLNIIKHEDGVINNKISIDQSQKTVKLNGTNDKNTRNLSRDLTEKHRH